VTELEKIPDWIKGIGAALGGAAFWGHMLKYKSDSKGHQVTEKHNADQHDEKMIEAVRQVMSESRQADQDARKADQETRKIDQERIKNLEDKWETLQDKYIKLAEDHVTLKGEHTHCQTEISGLKEQVRGLIEGQQKAELQREREVRDLKEDNINLRGMYEIAKAAASEKDILQRIDDNTQAIEEVKASAHPESVTVHAKEVQVNAAVAIEAGAVETQEETSG
jgi:uncharacterized protein (DUF3084 family)